MVRLVACLTERDEIVGCITARLAALQMMNVQDGVFRPTIAMLALVTITSKYIFADVPEAKLFALLIFFTGNLWILNLLRIELCYLDGGLADWQHGMHHTDDHQVRLHLLAYTGRKPSIRNAAVIKSWRTVTALTISPRPALLPSGSQQFHNVSPQFYLGDI